MEGMEAVSVENLLKSYDDIQTVIAKKNVEDISFFFSKRLLKKYVCTNLIFASISFLFRTPKTSVGM